MKRTSTEKELALFLFLHGWEQRNGHSWLHYYKDSFLSKDVSKSYTYYIFSTDLGGTGDRGRVSFDTIDELIKYLTKGY